MLTCIITTLMWPPDPSQCVYDAAPQATAAASSGSLAIPHLAVFMAMYLVHSHYLKKGGN